MTADQDQSNQEEQQERSTKGHSLLHGNLSVVNTEKFMIEALREAESAFREDETPIGAVVVHKNRIIGRGHNRTISLSDPTAHAEMVALTSASETLGEWRLIECDLYCTVEPCVMCAGASVLARVRKIYYGATEPKFGGCGSLFQIPLDTRLNHQCEIEGGIMAHESAELLRDFFQQLRLKKANRN